MNWEDERIKLLKMLREMGVEQPAKLYPKSQAWSVDTTPENQLDRMKAHVIQIAQFKDAQEPRND
jgi:hypothetical protein